MAHERRHNALATAIVAAALCCMPALQQCGAPDSTPTPRRTAYPRVATYEREYTPLPNCPLVLYANTSTTEIGGGGDMPGKHHWYSLRYPNYGATLHCTVSDCDGSVDEVVDNRVERMALNSGGLTSELATTTNEHGFSAQVLLTRDSPVTPLQFLATDRVRWVVTGMLCFDMGTGVNTDSLAPVVTAVEQDVNYALMRLKQR